MKYFSNLPKREYNTTIGPFTIVDMTSYYTLNDSSFEKNDISIDNTHTLIEAAQDTYGDVDSFWLFMFANKTINPFELLKFDNTTVTEDATNLTGIGLATNSGGDAIITTGSIVFPYIENSGDTWNYGSTGNFSLTGGFAIVDSFNPFSKRINLKYIQGFTFDISTSVNSIIKGKTSYDLYNKTQDPIELASVQEITDVLEITYQTTYVNEKNKKYLVVESEYPVISKTPPGETPGYEPVGTGGIQITNQVFIENRINKIKAYLPSKIKKSVFTKVIQNYKV